MPDRLSIRTQTALFVGLLCSVLVLATTLALALVESGNARQLIGHQLVTTARAMADRLALGMAERHREIGFLAGLDRMREAASGSFPGMRVLLETVQKDRPEYAWIGLAAADGTVLAATGGLLEGASVAQRDWFTAGLKGPAAIDVHAADLLQPLLGGAGREPLRFVDIAWPVRDAQSRVTAVLGVHLSWAWAQEIRRTVLSEGDRAQGISLTVTARDGRVIMGEGAFDRHWTAFHARTADRTEGWFAGREDDREDVLLGFARSGGLRDYKGLGWTAFARQPEDIAYAPLRRALWLTAGIGAGIALAGLALTWLVATRLTRPLHRLTDAAQLIGTDPHATSLPNVGGSLEVTALALALRALLRRLGGVELRLARAEARVTPDDTGEPGRDPLTGLLNRATFRERCGERLALARRHGHSLAVVLVDIDDLSRINAVHGTEAGDEAIRAVGRLALQVARETDLAARIEGEEFGVLIEGDEAAAASYGERLHKQVAGFDTLRARGVSVSIGVAGLLPEHDDIDDMLARADRALTAAKREGGNRIQGAALRR
jgi:diguanylate cyclase (GGDEF)-like protein